MARPLSTVFTSSQRTLDYLSQYIKHSFTPYYQIMLVHLSFILSKHSLPAYSNQKHSFQIINLKLNQLRLTFWAFSNTVTKTYIWGILIHSDSDGGVDEPGRGILLVYDLYQDVDSGHQLNSRTRPCWVVLQFKLTLESLHQSASDCPTNQTYIREFTSDCVRLSYKSNLH